MNSDNSLKDSGSDSDCSDSSKDFKPAVKSSSKILRPKYVVRRIKNTVFVVIPYLNRNYMVTSNDSKSKQNNSISKASIISDSDSSPKVSLSIKDSINYISKKSARKRNIIVSSDESDDEPLDQKLVKNIYIEDDESNLRPKRSSKISKVKETLLYQKKQKLGLNSGIDSSGNSSVDETEDSEDSEYDSIVSEADFIVQNISEDEEGLELLPELFARELGFRPAFDIFIKALVKTAYDPLYLSQIEKDDFDTHRGYQQILLKTKSYCTELSKVHSWTSDYLTALYTFPKCTSEPINLAEENEITELSFTLSLEGTSYNYSTLQPLTPTNKVKRFVISQKNWKDSVLCHKLYHFHRHKLDSIISLAQKLELKKKESNVAPIKNLFRHIMKKELISEWFAELERLLDASVKNAV